MFKEITTVEAAFEKHPDKIDLQKMIKALEEWPAKFTSGLISLLILQAAAFVINNDDPAVPEWKADFNDEDQEKWFPWYYGGDESGSGFRFFDSGLGWTYATASGGARLALKDQERADHMNEFFQEHYKNLYLILKK